MLRLAIDENFNHDIVRGLLRRLPNVVLLRIQDVGLFGVDDPTVLAWAADEGRVLPTHDVQTMTQHAYARIAADKPMPGVFEVARIAPLALVIEELILLVECSIDSEWEGQVRYLPLR